MISQISRQGFSTRQACAGAAALLLAWAAGGCSSNTPDVPADAAADAAVDASLDVPFDSGPVVADADSDVDTGPDIQFPDIPIDVPPQVGLWTQIIVPGLNNIALRGVWADATSRVYAVGTGGSVVGYDGLQWQVLTTGKFSSLNGITGTPGAKTPLPSACKASCCKPTPRRTTRWAKSSLLQAVAANQPIAKTAIRAPSTSAKVALAFIRHRLRQVAAAARFCRQF